MQNREKTLLRGANSATGRRMYSVAAMLVFGFSPASVQGVETNLGVCFQLALTRSTAISLSTDQIDQTDAQFNQARAAYFPTLSLQATKTQQAKSTNVLAKSLSPTQQTTSNLNFSQNLFQGFKDISTVGQRKKIRSSHEWSRKQAIQQLYKDVADSFYSLLLFQSDIILYHEQIASTKGRKTELAAANSSRRSMLNISPLIAYSAP